MPGHGPAARVIAQRGVALVTALLVVALASVLAGQIFWTLSLQVRRASTAFALEQARLYGLGAEDWAAQILREDAQDSDTDHRGEEWAVNLPPLPVEGGEIVGFLEDMQGRFNLNNLIQTDGELDDAALAQFQRLLSVLELDTQIAGRMADWIDTDIEQRFPDGAEDDFYSSLEIPYRAANSAITSITELYALEGIGPEQFQVLAPYLAALPRGSKLNVNTAPAPLLDALSDNLTSADAEAIVQEAEETGLENLDSINEKIEPEIAESLSVSTNFFRLTVRVSIGTVRYTMYSLLHRGAGGEIRTVLRSVGSE